MEKISADRLFISVSEAIALFGIAKSTLYRLIRQRKIPAINLGTRLVRIDRTAIEQFPIRETPLVKEKSKAKLYSLETEDCYTIGKISQKFGMKVNKYMIIRKINKHDIESLKNIIDSNELFPSEMLNEMTNDFFQNSESKDMWLTVEIEGKPIAIAYYAPEKMTEGTYNLYLIAVHKNFQAKGIGSQIMSYIEQQLKEISSRILIVETSGLPEFGCTRLFYEKLAYKNVAVIEDFYQTGEDKIIFLKKLDE